METLAQIIAKHNPHLSYEQAESLTMLGELAGVFSPIRVHDDVALYNEYDISNIVKLFEMIEQGMTDEEAIQGLKVQEGFVLVVSRSTRFQNPQVKPPVWPDNGKKYFV